MSKYRIPSTSSTLDPYDVQRRIAGDTLKPTASQVETSTVGNELETLTPFQIEEGRGTLGNSQFYQQALQNQLSNDEDFWSLTAKGLKNLAGTVVTEIGKTPGYIGGGLAAVGNELFSDGKDSMKMMVDNSWINAFESMNQSIKDFMPVHVKQEVLDGNVFDKLGSYAWWAETGAEGIGFMLAMYGPGALLKAGKVGQRIMGSIEKLSEAGADVANWMNLPMDTLKPYRMSLNSARKVEGYASAVSNAMLESAAEAANTFDNIKESKKQEYLNQGLDESTADQLANQDAGKGAAAVFKTNMIILPVSNALEEKWLWKSVGLSGQDEAAEGLISQFMKDGVLDIDGLKQATKKTFKEKAGTFSKNVGKNFAKEGVFEEGLQTITQQQVEKGNIKDNALEQFFNSITSYTDDFENNKDLHESIALGGLLGAVASVFMSRNEARNNEEAIYGSRSGKYDNILNKIGLRQVRKDQRGLSDLLSQNWINNYKSYNDLLTDGKLDPTKLAALPQEQQALSNLHFLYDSAVEMGDKQTQEVVGQYLSANYAQAFLGQTGGKEIFRQHVENQVVPEWSKRFAEVKGREATPVEINEYKKRFLDSANEVFDNYSKVEDTHYPERYFQDKENPQTYKEFKQHYFNQKFQALTRANVAKRAIAQSNGEMAAAGIIEGSNLTGIQKTLKKINESIIEEQQKVEKESSDYYESLFTKKGVKELYDLYKSQKEVVPEVQQEIAENEAKDLKVAEAKVENIQTAEAKIQEAESIQDQPVFIKTKDGRVLQTMLDTDGTRYVDDNGNVRPITEDEQVQSTVVPQEDVQREIQKTEIPITPAQEISTDEPIDEKLHEAFLENDLGVGLYPSTGLHVIYENARGKVYDALTDDGLPKLNSSVHQRNWFKALDEITNINDYQVKVVNKTSADSEQLRVIIENGGGQVQDTDLFIFLYKDDSAVTIGVNSSQVESERERITTTKTSSKEKFDFINSLPEGTIFEYGEDQRIIIPAKRITKSGTEVFDLIPQLWNEDTNQWEDNPSAGTLVQKDRNGEYNANAAFPTAMMNSSGTNMDTGERFISKPKITLPSGISNPVFTSLYRPDTLYKELGKQSLSARIAPDSIYEAYLNHLGINMPKEIDDTLSRLSDVDIRKLEEVIGKGNLSSTGLWNAAARWSKEDYTKWYNSLQQPNTFLQPINITNGKRLVRRNADRSIVWNKAEGNVPDFSIENQRLVNGDIVQQYTAQGVKAGNKFYNFRIGDSVLVSNDQAYRLKQSLLNADEAKSVLYLLSLKQDAPQESVKLPVRTVIKEKNSTGGYSDKVFEETPVFGSNNEYGLIKSLINFGFGTSKGSIYLHNNDIEFIDFEGNKNTIPVKEIQKAFLDDDFSKIQSLMDFLAQKRFNVNENLLRADSDFQYPYLERTTNGGYTIKFKNEGKYKAFLLQSEKLLTDSVIAEGYPKRLARNLQFAKSPTVKIVEEIKVEETKEEPKVNPKLEQLRNRTKTQLPNLTADKIFSPAEILNQKLLNGEITKYCK